MSMKNKILLLATFLTIFLLSFSFVSAKPNKCTKIQDGILTYPDGHYFEGEPYKTGYDEYGFNYQAHISKYTSVMDDDDVVSISSKWNDAYLSNKDCNEDGLLDRHYGYDSYIGSGAWFFQKQSWFYKDEYSGEECEGVLSFKLVAPPTDAYLDCYKYECEEKQCIEYACSAWEGEICTEWNHDICTEYECLVLSDVCTSGMWYTSNGEEIGPMRTGSLALIEWLYEDTCGYSEPLYISEGPLGFGYYK